MSKHARLLTGPINSQLIKMTIPMAMGIAAVMVFQLVDSLYIGHLGTQELAAISFTFPVTFTILNLSVGLGIGAASVISRKIGEGNIKNVKRIASDSLILSFTIVSTVSILGLLTIPILFRLLGAPDALLPLITEYMLYWYAGIGLLVIPMTGNSILRATGNMLTPSIIMLISGGINAVLDPFLIFGWGPFPQLGIKGAAIASVISWLVCCILSFCILIFKDKLIELSLPSLTQLKNSWSDILYVGIPAALTNMLTPITTGFITSLIAGYGMVTVAGFGAAGRVEPIIFVFVLGLSTALPSFIGQNWGAGQLERVKHSLFFSLKVTVCLQLLVYAIIFFISPWVSLAFSKDPLVRAEIITMLRIIPLGYIGQGVSIILGSTFNAVNKPLWATSLAILRNLVFVVGLSWIGSFLYGVKGIYIGIVLANSIMGIGVYLWASRWVKNLESN